MKKTKKTTNGKRLTSLADLKPAPYNPRRIGDDAAAGLGVSLKEFGDLSGLVWNATTGHLVCGHQRLAQLKKRGARLADGAVVTSDGGRFPVRVVEWPLAREKAANVVANNPAIGGEFTSDLDTLLGEVKADIGPEMFGELELDELVGEGGEPVDLGTGNIEEKQAMSKLTVFLPAGEAALKKNIKALVEQAGGSVIDG